jgi:ATP-binding protein involved in chromosome partitioning
MAIDMLPTVKNIVAVSSGKGGVGKSTVAANLALALNKLGKTVGLLDADIYGPSQPQMMGISDQKPTKIEDKIIPLESHGIKVNSIGFSIDVATPVAWRGPMIVQALEQMLMQTEWGDIDFLVIDMPPGTGDIQIALAQKFNLAGAVIVTTPQNIAIIDVIKGFKMFEAAKVPILGVVENMSTHTCKNCGHEEHIFGSGGAELLESEYGIKILGSLPLNSDIRHYADAGAPTVVGDPDSKAAAVYVSIAEQIVPPLEEAWKIKQEKIEAMKPKIQ